MILKNKRDFLFVILAGFFITNAITAEMVGGKVIDIGKLLKPDLFYISVGILPWPIVFLATDIINEFYGKKIVRKLSILTACLIGYAFLVLFFSMQIPAIKDSPIPDAAFKQVFGQSMWIIVGSITAFIVSQLIDVFVFWLIREKTGGKMIWLRSTGSTVVSQLFDSFIVGGIGLWLPSRLDPEHYHVSTELFMKIFLTGYTVKLLIAVCLTPLIYLGHFLIDNYLGEKESKKDIEESAKESLEKS